jgi:N-acetylneuraminate synthase
VNIPLIIAEIGASHNGSLERAIKTVDAAARAGAQAIKLQCYDGHTMVANREHVIEGGPWAGKNLYALYKDAAMPWRWHETLFAVAHSHDMQAFSTPFDETAVAYLETLMCPMYKVASHEITDLHLIAMIAGTGKPIIISTGMATWQEIKRAIDAAKGCSKITLLKCTSAYPAPIEQTNLTTILNMRMWFDVDVGLSDHTTGALAATIATTLGVTIIEKHITLDRAGGPDDGFASLPDEFAEMVRQVRATAAAIGRPTYGPTPAEAPSLALRRGLYAMRDLQPGDMITHAKVAARRPSSAISAEWLPELIGKQIVQAVRAGAPLAWENIAYSPNRERIRDPQ